MMVKFLTKVKEYLKHQDTLSITYYLDTGDFYIKEVGCDILYRDNRYIIVPLICEEILELKRIGKITIDIDTHDLANDVVLCVNDLLNNNKARHGYSPNQLNTFIMNYLNTSEWLYALEKYNVIDDKDVLNYLKAIV